MAQLLGDHALPRRDLGVEALLCLAGELVRLSLRRVLGGVSTALDVGQRALQLLRVFFFHPLIPPQDRYPSVRRVVVSLNRSTVLSVSPSSRRFVGGGAGRRMWLSSESATLLLVALMRRLFAARAEPMSVSAKSSLGQRSCAIESQNFVEVQGIPCTNLRSSSRGLAVGYVAGVESGRYRRVRSGLLFRRREPIRYDVDDLGQTSAR